MKESRVVALAYLKYSKIATSWTRPKLEINAEKLRIFLTFNSNIHAVNFFFLFQPKAYNLLKYILSPITSYTFRCL